MSVTKALAAIFFCGALLGWGVPRFVNGLPSAGSVASEAGAVAAPASPLIAAATEAPTVATTPAPAEQAGDVTPTAVPQAARASPPPIVAHPSQPPAQPTGLSDAEQIALQRQLEAQGKAYLRALQAQDAAALTAMLAGRCTGTDVPALIARRRAEISAVAGVPIDQLTPLNQYVGHFDPFAGEAHTILQLDNSGARVQLPAADGWLLEGGAWKSVNC
jgi:hypothetical protein